jgi:hypothetical protein
VPEELAGWGSISLQRIVDRGCLLPGHHRLSLQSDIVCNYLVPGRRTEPAAAQDDVAAITAIDTI